MSRCFPFPPAGYEPKPSTGIIDLLTKEKRREKKHKKEKRDEEKREHKEKRLRSKDKHKEKKDQKHKDRKKGKDRDKGRTSEDIKAEGGAQGHNELHIKESWQKAEENKYSTFEEELDRKTSNVGTENPIIKNFTNSIQRKFEGMGTASASLEKERVAASRMFSVQAASVQRRNVAISPQRRAECISSTISLEKERNKMHGCISSATALEKESSKMQEKAAVSRGTEESRNHGISRSMESVSGLAIRRTDGSTAGMEKGKCGERSLVSNSVIPGFERGKLGAKILPPSSIAAGQRRSDVSCMPVENLSSIHHKTEVASIPSLYSRIKGVDSVLTMEKERASGGEIFQVGQAVEKDTHKKVEGKNKTQGQLAEQKSVKKSKAKDKDRLTEEKKKEENAEDIEHNKLRNSGKKDQIDTLNSKPLAPHKDNAVGIACAEGTLKKKKYLDTNGYLQENDERPDKKPRMTSSSQSLLNGRPLESHLSAPSSLPLQSGAINYSRPGRLLENKEREINCNAISQQSSLTKKSDVSLVLLPHPDSKYLSQIYSVPKMAELPEIDDQEWLFSCHEKSKIELKAEKIPQVFAEAMRIDSADILALPYVVPF